MLCVGSLVLGTVPVLAADCSGTLTMPFVASPAIGGRYSPPDGFDVATQPAADLTAGFEVNGVLTAQRDGDCAVPGATASVAARDAGQSGFSTRRTGTTNSQGEWRWTVKPPHTTDLRGTVQVGDERAVSAIVRRTVRPAVSATFGSGSGCTVFGQGSTFPKKPNHPVWLQRRITSGNTEKGYLTVSKAVTASDGSFRVSYRAPCGADYALAAYVPASATNTAGRSFYVDLHVLATR